MKNLFFILLLAVLSLKASAQVTVGMSKEPIKGALLDLKESVNPSLDPANRTADDLKNADKGIMMPRVKLSKYDVISELGITTALEKLQATGMIVFNINPDADGLPEGLVQWSGEDWKPVGGGGLGQGAIDDIDCDKIAIQGTYVAGRTLKSSEHTMTISVNVTRKGSYRILAEAIQGDAQGEANGYVFTATGEFAAVGANVVTLIGQGTPVKSSGEVGFDDKLLIYVNDKLIACEPTNEVLNIPPAFTIACNFTKSNGTYKKDEAVSETVEHSITVRISSDIAGGAYHIYTDTINGVWFEGRGTLLKGTQQISLFAHGTPKTGGSYDYAIHTNSTLLTSNCSVTVSVIYPNFEIRVYGNYAGEWLLTDNACAIPMMTKNPALFGLTGGSSGTPNLNAPVLVNNITVHPAQYVNNVSSIPAGTNMVFVSYSIAPNATMQAALRDFVINRKGFVIYSVEDNSALTEIANLFNSPIDVYEVGYGNPLLPLNRGNSLVNGLFQNLQGKSIHRDGGYNRNFRSYPNWDVVAFAGDNTTEARMIVHKQYPIVLCGDGGVFAGGYNYYNADDYRPARVSSSRNPEVFDGGYNSHLILNLIMWAIEETNR